MPSSLDGPTSDPAEFQRRAALVGAAFETLSEQALVGAGFELVERNSYYDSIGIQVDFKVKNKKGVVFLVECKGSLHGARPGLERTDTVKKALCNAFLLNKLGHGPFLILTSHLPQEGTDSYRMLMAAGRDIVLDVIPILDKQLMKRLEWFTRADRSDIDTYIKNHPQLFQPATSRSRTKQLRLPLVAAPAKPRKQSRRRQSGG